MQAQKGEEMEIDHCIAIAVSRQMASGGSYIAYSAARKLGFKYLDNEVLYRAAKFMGLDVRELSDREERIENFITKIARSFCFGSAEAPFVYPSGIAVSDAEIFDTGVSSPVSIPASLIFFSIIS